MKSRVLAVVVAAAVGGFASSMYAQDSKKPPHPDAAADPSLRQGAAALLPDYGNQPREPREARDTVAKPKTGDAVASGTESTEQSRKKQ